MVTNYKNEEMCWIFITNKIARHSPNQHHSGMLFTQIHTEHHKNNRSLWLQIDIVANIFISSTIHNNEKKTKSNSLESHSWHFSIHMEIWLWLHCNLAPFLRLLLQPLLLLSSVWWPGSRKLAFYQNPIYWSMGLVSKCINLSKHSQF